eukprot:Phypoly_transcript_02503.p1 GENE.Phypoly_transcript_02503~~Phypoly_transcript_02503.p1  ORF type:complete len:833 (+),score=95.20 Phypoly_transcript_02503:288-2786(+)
MKISFEVPPEDFLAISQLLSRELKRKVKAWELTNATPILTYLLTQANNSEGGSLDLIVANIHYALELYDDTNLAGEALYESLVEVTLSLVYPADNSMPPFRYLQVFTRLNEPFKTHIEETIFPLFDALTTELANVQLLKTIHAYAISVSCGFVSGEASLDFAMSKLVSQRTECGLLVLATLIEQSLPALNSVNGAKRDQIVTELQKIKEDKFARSVQQIIAAFHSMALAKNDTNNIPNDIPKNTPDDLSNTKNTTAPQLPNTIISNNPNIHTNSTTNNITKNNSNDNPHPTLFNNANDLNSPTENSPVPTLPIAIYTKNETGHFPNSPHRTLINANATNNTNSSQTKSPPTPLDTKNGNGHPTSPHRTLINTANGTNNTNSSQIKTPPTAEDTKNGNGHPNSPHRTLINTVNSPNSLNSPTNNTSPNSTNNSQTKTPAPASPTAFDTKNGNGQNSPTPVKGNSIQLAEGGDCDPESSETSKGLGLHWKRLFGEFESGSVMSLSCDSKGNLFSGGKGSLRLWNRSGKEISKYSFPLHNTHPMDLDRAINRLYAAGLPKASTTSNPAIIHFSVSEEYAVKVEKAISKTEVHRISCIKALYAENNSTKMFATGETHKQSDTGFVRIYSENMEPYITYQEHKGHVSGLARCPRSTNLFFSCAQDASIKLWDSRQIKSAATIGCHQAMVSSLGTHPSHENLLVSGGLDGIVNLWDVRAAGESVSNCRVDIKSRILQVALVPNSASHVIASTTQGSGTSLGLFMLDFAQKTFSLTQRRSLHPQGDDVSKPAPGGDVSTPNSDGYYLALEFSPVAPNELYAAGMGKNDKSVVDVYECTI